MSTKADTKPKARRSLLVGGWVKQERGWWTHPNGGICRERGGWWAYRSENRPRGPYKTAGEAALSIDKVSDGGPLTHESKQSANPPFAAPTC